MSKNFNDPLNRSSRPLEDDPAYITRREVNEDTGTMWGWIAGAAVLALVAAFIFGGNNNSQQMADQGAGTVPGVTRSTQAPSGSLPSGSLQPSNPSATPNAAPSTTSPGASTTGSGSSQ